MSTWAVTIDPEWGTPLEIYLQRNEKISIRQYPLDRVLFAIKTITTRDTAGDLYESTLEACLSVIYYPECLNLLISKSFRDIWFTLMDKYRTKHQAGLTTTVGFLAHNKKLEPFVDSLLDSKPQGANKFFQCLSLQALQVSKLDTQTLAIAFGRGDKFLRPPFDVKTPGTFIPDTGGHTTNTTTFLNENLFNSRHKFLSTYYRVPSCGWPAVLLVMWLIMMHSPYDSGEKENYVSQLAAIRELAFRYFLVCAPEERLIMEALVRETAGSMQCGYKGPVDSDDVRMILLALTRQLKSPMERRTPQSFYCLTLLSKYAAVVTEGFVDDLYPGFLNTGFNRLWVEFPGDPVRVLGAETSNHLLVFANTQIENAHDSLKLKPASIPEVILALVKGDLVSLTGRLMIVQATSRDTYESRGLRSELISLLSSISKSLARNQQTHSQFSAFYPDWIKTLIRILHFQAIGASPTSTNPIKIAWLEFGIALGYKELYERQTACACGVKPRIGYKEPLRTEDGVDIPLALRCLLRPKVFGKVLATPYGATLHGEQERHGHGSSNDSALVRSNLDDAFPSPGFMFG
ncbi:hypothetical protein BDV93DRAFT_545469 [Ceratobasidium sp. AG-I]|nr:hypothetical protein BDV93DRAFT_545469 [Ceratobasidium sp. AG-I]